MKKLKITHSTYLKNLNKQSGELPQKDRIPVLENQELLVEEDIEDHGDHYKVKANFYVFKGHSDIMEPEQPSAPIDGSGLPKCGVDLIKEFEGFRSNAYADPIHGWSVPTIGYGTTMYANGKRVRQGETITRHEAEKELVHHIKVSCLPQLEKIPNWKRMNENQKGAIMSFAYNLGSHFYRGSGFASITTLIQSPDKWSDCSYVEDQFIKYRNPGTSAEAGLKRRRIREAQLFCK